MEKRERQRDTQTWGQTSRRIIHIRRQSDRQMFIIEQIDESYGQKPKRETDKPAAR